MAFIVHRCPCGLACIFNMVVALGYKKYNWVFHFAFNKGLVLVQKRDQKLSCVLDGVHAGDIEFRL